MKNCNILSSVLIFSPYLLNVMILVPCLHLARRVYYVFLTKRSFRLDILCRLTSEINAGQRKLGYSQKIRPQRF